MKISRRHGNAVEIRDIYGPAVFGDLSAELQPFFIVCPDVVTAPQSRHGGRLGCGRESGKLQGDDSGVRKILWGVPIKALHLGNVEFVLCERSGYPVCSSRIFDAAPLAAACPDTYPGNGGVTNVSGE